ncbi:TonB-dependent receptor [Erythrobacter alti]|uniref:TonB-dependent receptor n=1 Tax=Erythrobacter alti TaxID=1896145 RepID=UPI0030F3A1FF
MGNFVASLRSGRSALLAGSAAIGLMASPAFAQDQADQDEPQARGNTIVVTATKRDANIQDIPFSINAQTAEDIQRSGAVTLEDLSRNVAGLSVQNLGPGQSQVSVRGVSAGQVARDQPGVKEQVGVYLDESVISTSLFTPDIDLYDLNRVETLRGPQGTLFGSGSVGGTIRYITNQPILGVTEGSVEANANVVDEDDFGWHMKGAINVPIGENAAARAVGYYTEYAGFIDALGPGGGENINGGARYGGRLSILFEPFAEVRITPRILFQKVEADGFNRQEVYNLYANPFTTTRPPVTFNEREQYLLLREAFEDETLLADLVAEIDVGGVTLTSVTSYLNRDILVSRDASALTGSVSVDLGFPDAGVLLPSNLVDTTSLENFSQELRISSNDDGPFQWVFGGFYSKTDRFYTQRLPTPGYAAFTDATLGDGTSAGAANGFPNLDSPYNADFPFEMEQLAVFGEGTYEVTDRFDVTLGARYYDYSENRAFTNGGLFAPGDNSTDETNSSGINPRLLLSYDVSDSVTINAQAAKGFRLGGVNDPLNVRLCTPEDAELFGGFPSYEDESLWNYEIGAKASGRGFYANVAGFYNDIQNLQVTLDARSCSSRVVFNVEEAHSMGLEAEFGVSPAVGLDLSVSASVIEAEFDTTLPGVFAEVTGIREGNRLPSVPKFQASVAGSYEWDISSSALAFIAGSFQHVGTRYTQPADQENNPQTFVHGLPFGGQPANAATTLDLELPSYQLVGLSAGVEFDNGFSLTAYVNNLFDENALLAFDRERGGRARLGFSVNQPRTIGLTARKEF